MTRNKKRIEKRFSSRLTKTIYFHRTEKKNKARVWPCLRDKPDLSPQPSHVEGPDVHAVDENGSSLRVVEPQKQIDHRRLAVSRRPHLVLLQYRFLFSAG